VLFEKYNVNNVVVVTVVCELEVKLVALLMVENSVDENKRVVGSGKKVEENITMLLFVKIDVVVLLDVVNEDSVKGDVIILDELVVFFVLVDDEKGIEVIFDLLEMDDDEIELVVDVSLVIEIALVVSILVLVESDVAIDVAE
jgi:hypothetical protein